MHCENAPCIMSCPAGCLRKDPTTNFTIYASDNCIACHSCAMACPFGIPSFGKDGRITKCDGCYIRVKYGLQPACVLACPSGALSLCEQEQQLTGTRGNSLKMIVHAQLIK
ncbi:4Fe-4S dicluster domain-containing protein [Chloroflexota bacterium]